VTTGLDDPEVVSLTADGHVLHHGAQVTLDELADALLERPGHPLLVCADEDALAGHLLYVLEVGKRTDPERRLYVAVSCLGRTEALPVAHDRIPIPGVGVELSVWPEDDPEVRFETARGYAADRGELKDLIEDAFEEWEDVKPPVYADLAAFVSDSPSANVYETARCARVVEAVDVLFYLGGAPPALPPVRASPETRGHRQLRKLPPPARVLLAGDYLAPMDLPLVRTAPDCGSHAGRSLTRLEPGPFAFRWLGKWRLAPEPEAPEVALARLREAGERYRERRRWDPSYQDIELLYSRHLPWSRLVDGVTLVRDAGWLEARVAVRVIGERVPSARPSGYDEVPTDQEFHFLPVEWRETPDPVLRVEVRDGARFRVGDEEVAGLGALRTFLSTLHEPGPAGLYAPAELEAQGVIEALCELVAADVRVVALGLLDEDH